MKIVYDFFCLAHDQPCLLYFQDFLTYTLTGDAECLNNFFVIPALDGTNGVELRVQGDLTTTVGNVQVCLYTSTSL